MRSARRSVLALGLAALAVPAAAHAKKWLAPAEARARANPVASSPGAVAKGRALYTEHCESCHGPQGRGDGPDARPGHDAPHDLSDAALQARVTDGEMMWKLSEGRTEGGHVVMPGFSEDIPSESDRWSVVHYVRTLKAAAPAKAH